MEWPRDKLAAWGAATVLHALAFALVASAAIIPDEIQRDTPVIVEIVELAPPLEPEPEVAPEPEAPPEPPPEPDPAPAPLPPKPEAPVTAIIQSRTEDARLARPPVQSPSPRRTPSAQSRTRQSAQSGGPPYAETPPPPVQRTLRAIGCARLSPSQRVNCPSDELEDDFISAMVSEARGAKEIYDPVWDVYQARTMLDRMRNSPGGPGMFSQADNAPPVMSNGVGGIAASGVSTQLNSNPDPVFDGGRYQGWDEDAGAPGK